MEFASKEEREKVVQEYWSNLASGDRFALDWLFKEYYQDLYEYGIRLKNDIEMIQDCIQELFLSLWVKRTRLNSPNSVKAYLIVSLRNQIIDQVKKQRRKEDSQKIIREELFTDLFTSNDFEMSEEFTQDQKKELAQAINQLNNRQREVIFLRYYNGLNNHEIADVMQINYQSVKNNLSRAIINLRGLVKTVGLLGVIILLKSMR